VPRALATAAAVAALLGPAAGPSFRLELDGTARGAAGVVHVALRAPRGDHVTLYVPAGWRLETAQTVGTVVARGRVGGEPGTLAVTRAGDAACGPVPFAAAWAWSGRTPLRVEVSATPGDERRVAFRIDLCAPAVPALDLTFVRGVLANPFAVGLYTWRAVEADGARELQSQVPVPHVLAVRGSLRRGRLTVRGRLLIEGLREEGARVVVTGGPTRSAAGRHALGTARTGGSGRFTLRSRARGIRWVRARTLPRTAKCARPLAPFCSGLVAPAFAHATRVGGS
jgi:hypothetical protein